MTLKPWRSVVDPREDLRKGEALDAAEFAVHLDLVQDQRGNAIYWQPEQFFSRSYLTRNLLDCAAALATARIHELGWLWAQALLAECIVDRPLRRDQRRDSGQRWIAGGLTRK
jgi:hypothetical protein